MRADDQSATSLTIEVFQCYGAVPIVGVKDIGFRCTHHLTSDFAHANPIMSRDCVCGGRRGFGVNVQRADVKA